MKVCVLSAELFPAQRPIRQDRGGPGKREEGAQAMQLPKHCLCFAVNAPTVFVIVNEVELPQCLLFELRKT